MFDYVIVGGGSAGCVVAARLAEDPGTRVLLLEAGPDASAVEEVRVPAAYSRLFRSQYDWNYVTLPQERADARPVYWPRGKVARRLVRDRRDDLRPRPPRRLRRLAEHLRLHRVGVQRPVPVLPPRRGQLPWREPVPRHRRPAAGPGPAAQVRARPAVHRGGRAARRPGQRRLQRGAAGGRRLLPGDPAGRRALQRRRRLPGEQAGEPDDHHQRPRHRPRHRGRARRGRDLPLPGPGRDGTRRGRGHPGRGRDRDAAAAHAVRHRARRPPARARHLRDRRHARRGREPDGPPGRAGALVDARA